MRTTSSLLAAVLSIALTRAPTPTWSFAEDVFAEVVASVVVVLELDEGGETAAQGSSVVVGAYEVVTNCHLLERAADVGVRETAETLPPPLRNSASYCDNASECQRCPWPATDAQRRSVRSRPWSRNVSVHHLAVNIDNLALTALLRHFFITLSFASSTLSLPEVHTYRLFSAS